MDPLDLFTAHRKLILRMAHTSALKSGLPWEEFYSLGVELHFRRCHEWDPTRSRYSTFLWYVCRNAFTTFIGKEYVYRKHICPVDDLPPTADLEQDVYWFQDLQEQLSGEAQACAREVLAVAREVLRGDESPEVMQEALRTALRERGWPKGTLHRVFTEIHRAIRTLN